MTRVNRLAIIILTLTLTIVLAGCITVNVPPVSEAGPPTAPKGAPQLTELSFSLSVQPPQTYAEHTIPIYLRSRQTLHLEWQVLQGRTFWMSCTTPRGELIGATAGGLLQIASICEALQGIGTLTFSPSDPRYAEAANKLGEGYYFFHPHIEAGVATTVTIKILYWIED